MINTVKMKTVLAAYKHDFLRKGSGPDGESHWDDEKYKWIAVKHFQDHWNVDADDFGAMFMAILSLLADFAENEPIREYVTDIGTWDLHLTYSDGKKLYSTGSMCGKVLSGEIDIADFIRERVPIEDLALFGLD